MTQHETAVIFDLDGTLVDNRASFHQAYAVFAARHPDLFRTDSTADEEALVGFYRSGFDRAHYDALWKERQGGRPIPYGALREEWAMTYADNALPFPFAKDVLCYLRERGCRIGLLTNGNSLRQWAKIHSSGLYPYFDDIVVSGDYPFEKPDPAIYRLSLSHLGARAEEALFVGDTVETDILGANRAGIRSLWLSKRSDNPANATYVAPDVTFLKTLY